MIDHEQVRSLHQSLADQLSNDPEFTRLSPEDREQRGRAVINSLVYNWSVRHAQATGRQLSDAEERAYSDAVFNRAFRHGRLEPLLQDERIENIFVNGGQTWVDPGNGPMVQIGPLADTDADLIELVQDLARTNGNSERVLSTAQPLLGLRLGDGSRLQAITHVTPRPYVTIRRHRTLAITLDDLIRLGAIDSVLAGFLSACVRARLNVMICGSQGVGKTSLLRALIAEIPASERFATLETEFELYAHEDNYHTQVLPMEARTGNGEVVDGRAIGEITLADLIPAALRMSLTRLIVGEVRAAEILPMLDVMLNSEGGSMCTLHVRRPEQVFRRIATLCARYAPGGMGTDLAFEIAADALDIIVHVRMWDESAIGGSRHRFVSDVLEVTGMGDHGRPATNVIFGPRDPEPRAVPRIQPSSRLQSTLARVGFDVTELDRQYGAWAKPLQTRTQVV
ncbi:CpaF family protein [Catenulispora sp. NL8]|uniref:CpaF family protein n=1 Tax=Catenulispora pinistramenti TaxID=2705254 RepID=A0ABS5KHN0_9ACTN|nr:CpaF/VirB11 family protein [Catenulispora pinistramenti]MBS2545375.1 CpaF family protein [Catenulispora pinistramenti]